MKRNRLVQPSNKTKLFSDTANHFAKYRYISGLVVLSVIVLLVTGFMSADVQDTASQSQVIDLPGLSAAEQRQSKPLLPTQQQSQIQTLAALPTTPVITELDNTESDSLSEGEVNEIEALDQELDTTSLIEKSEPELDWEEVIVKSGDNLSLIFPRVGLTAKDVYLVTRLDKKTIGPLLNLKPGQAIHFGTLIQEDGTTSLEALKVILSPIETFYVQKVDQVYQAETITREVDLLQKHVTGSIESSLFEAGLTAGLTDKVVMEMAHIFGWDIDFALDLRKGDHFKLIYDEVFLDGNKIDDGNILAAEFTNRGKTFRAIRFADSKGWGRYYSPEGDSMRKTFNRTPVPLSRISSRFNPNRKHPVLKTNRPHRGVDYAAKTGTPILATGDGKIDFVGTKGGYGRTVILSHGGKYTTLYAHMSRYKKGIRSGKRVKQGQTIGYIGSSGLATGPHLHYEFRVHGVHRNPLTVKLPKAEALAKKYRAEFKTQAAPLISQLDILVNTAIAQGE
jgi:murein DD-endopeptidase MepM/ murein hydrolase activator NlpD